MQYVFCPFVITHQATDKKIVVKYWPGQFKINYVTTYNDGAVSDRTFEWQGSVESNSQMLERKLKRTSRISDREVIEFMLKDLAWKLIIDINWANLDTENVYLNQ